MSKKDLFKSTVIVLVVILVAAAFIGILDYAFSQLIQLLAKIG